MKELTQYSNLPYCELGRSCEVHCRLWSLDTRKFCLTCPRLKTPYLTEASMACSIELARCLRRRFTENAAYSESVAKGYADQSYQQCHESWLRLGVFASPMIVSEECIDAFPLQLIISSMSETRLMRSP